MAAKSVATVGDVKATVGSKPGVENSTGTWKAGSVSHKSYPALKTAGKEVIYEASCEFEYSGTDNSSGAAVKSSETVTLKAKTTVLQKGSNGVILDGDSAEGDYGNKLQAASMKPLKSA